MGSLKADSEQAYRLPVLLTVEEAGALLRIGRTKAYAMAREWRETDGQSGLPVIDLGHVLRVPRRALEELVGAELGDEIRAEPEPSAHSQTPGPRNRSQNRDASQLDLFERTDD